MAWDRQLAMDYFYDNFRSYQSQREQYLYKEKTPVYLKLHDTYLALEKVNEICKEAALTKEGLYESIEKLISHTSPDDRAHDRELYTAIVREHCLELKNKLDSGELIFE